MKQDNERWDYK